MEEDSAGTERTNLSGLERRESNSLSDPEGPSLHHQRLLRNSRTTTMTTTDEDVSSPTPPPPPNLPVSSIRDHRCPVHSHALVRHESSRSTLSSRTSGGGGITCGNRDIQHETAVLHRHLPALKKYDLKTSTIRQHYYPEGGYGWLVCACAFLVQILTTGMQLSYGVLSVELQQHFGPNSVMQAGWLGALSMATSLFMAPFVVALCRRKSTRLTGVFGGLVMALACLFTSFAQQLHQTFISYGILMGIGIGLVREAANLMVGQYFKRRREFIEIMVQAGSGIGIALFSVFFREAISSMGWRPGLQAVTGVLCSAFFLGVFYRSASLYHPQRRAILHIKNQKRKIKDKRGRAEDKPPYFDFATIKTRTLQIIMLSSSIASLGIYTPIFYLAFHCKEEGLDPSSILLIQTFVGFAFAISTLGFGLLVVNERNEQCHIARQYLCQAALFGLALAILTLATIRGYHSYVLFAWIYGSCLGGYHFTLKAYTYETMRARHFPRAWAFVQWAKAMPILFGVPITGYINNMHQGPSSTRSGFYFAFVVTLVGASSLFLMNLHRQRLHKRNQTVRFSNTVLQDGSRMSTPASTTSSSYAIVGDHRHGGYDDRDDGNGVGVGVNTVVDGVGPRMYVCAGGDACVHRHNHRLTMQGCSNNSLSFATSSSVDVLDPRRVNSDNLTCISEEGMADYYVHGTDCIASCNKVENYLLYGEFENNGDGDGVLGNTDCQSSHQRPQLCKQGICKHGNRTTTYHHPEPINSSNIILNGQTEIVNNNNDSDDDEDGDDEASDLVIQLPPAQSQMGETSAYPRSSALKNPDRIGPRTRDITVVEEMTTSV